MVQNNRQFIRISFIIVILAASMGWLFASTFWQFDASIVMGDPTTDGEGDWVDVMASIADRLLLLFLDLASPDG